MKKHGDEYECMFDSCNSNNVLFGGSFNGLCNYAIIHKHVQFNMYCDCMWGCTVVFDAHDDGS